MLHRRLNLHLHASLKQLLLTLYTRSHVAATGYSKVSRGLRFPLEVSGLCTRTKFSEGSGWGQWRSRYAIHAGRQSNGKAFRSHLLLPLKFKVLTFSLRRTSISTSCSKISNDFWQPQNHMVLMSPHIAMRVGLYLNTHQRVFLAYSL